ncbi:hypothetical protein BDV98DRAFT_381108 [Pterulicium gracile]|uniref:Uncharacterized protein n=1 Tax=Pterulicium gracile TaxID=1884261 RepID=A0A5C3QP09_9AGAR|nr:hypothetical protein BDV98DRAFT_381108 [Pterula gracilis]
MTNHPSLINSSQTAIKHRPKMPTSNSTITSSTPTNSSPLATSLWSCQLANTLSLHVDRDANCNVRAETSCLPGCIWRTKLARSVYETLREQEAKLGAVGSRGGKTSSSGATTSGEAQIIRMYEHGLSAVVLCTVPHAGQGYLSSSAIDGSEVFHGEALSFEKLVDVVDARVVYFPSYACTSFASGQAISSFFLSPPAPASLEVKAYGIAFTLPSETSNPPTTSPQLRTFNPMKVLRSCDSAYRPQRSYIDHLDTDASSSSSSFCNSEYDIDTTSSWNSGLDVCGMLRAKETELVLSQCKESMTPPDGFLDQSPPCSKVSLPPIRALNSSVTKSERRNTLERLPRSSPSSPARRHTFNPRRNQSFSL